MFHELDRVLGPYLCGDGRQRVDLIWKDGHKKTQLLARWILEQKLGRFLVDDETVDHKDNDKTNDHPDNLQVLTMIENSKKSAKPIEWFTFSCPCCGVTATKRASHVRHHHKQGKSGPYCSKSCAGKMHN